MDTLTSRQISELKGQAQRLQATLKVGKEGLSPQFLAALDEFAPELLEGDGFAARGGHDKPPEEPEEPGTGG